MRKRLTAILQTPAFNPSIAVPDLQTTVVGYSRHAIGGPKRARVDLRGDAAMLLQVFNLLRAPIEIYDEEVGIVWWGFVAKVTVELANLTIGVSIDDMANELAVVYTRPTPDPGTGTRKGITALAEDALSIAAYGRKQRRVTLSDASDAAAEAYRDALFAQIKRPIRTIDLSNGDASTARGQLECWGWLDTLDWLHYARTAGLIQHSVAGGTSHTLPVGGGRIAQSFTTPAAAAGWSASDLTLRIKLTGTPTDNVIVSLRSDSAGSPGAALGTVTAASAALAGRAAWTTFTLSSLVPLTPATTYWLQVERTQPTDDGTVVAVDVDESASYASGVLRVWDGAAWVARDPDADLLFQVLGAEETTGQIQTLITETGQFFTGSQVIGGSNVFTNQYRTGDRTGLQELLDLCKAGGPNGRRLLPRVNQRRLLVVEEEPAEPPLNQAITFLTRTNELVTPLGAPIANAACPAGIWVRPLELVAALGRAEALFLEETSYDPVKDRLSFTPRNQRDPRDATKVKDR